MQWKKYVNWFIKHLWWALGRVLRVRDNCAKVLISSIPCIVALLNALNCSQCEWLILVCFWRRIFSFLTRKWTFSQNPEIFIQKWIKKRFWAPFLLFNGQKFQNRSSLAVYFNSSCVVQRWNWAIRDISVHFTSFQSVWVGLSWFKLI